MTFVEETTYERKKFSKEPLDKGEYENCLFKQCDFSKADLADIRFTECEFLECDFSLALLTKTALRDALFKGCRILGARIESRDEMGLSISFDNCQLDNTSFYKAKTKKPVFRDSRLHETDFTECDLSNALFDNCDLSGAVFDNTDLEKADFRTSRNYIIDPENNRIKKAKFSLYGLSGLLGKYDIEIDSTA